MSSDPQLISTPVTADLLHGALEIEETAAGVRPHRLPRWARAQADAQLTMAESQPSGVRLAFTTEATVVELRASAVRFGFRGAPSRPAGVFDLVVDGRLSDQASLGDATSIIIDAATGEQETRPGAVATITFDELPAGTKSIEIWLPHNENIELVELRTDAPVRPGDRGAAPLWLHHGSSISQGSNAEHPTGTWPAIAASIADVDLVNLGFGGSALLDPFTARTIRDTPADLISLKIGINLVNTDLMRLRAFGPAVHGFLDTIRDGHPDVPLLVVSSSAVSDPRGHPRSGRVRRGRAGRGRRQVPRDRRPGRAGRRQAHPDRHPGTARRDRAATSRRRREPALPGRAAAVRTGRHDDLPLPDRLHPDGATHRRIGERFADLAFATGAFAPTTGHRP